MLGRVRRPSMSSLEELELERAPPKIIKGDPFSIYESTLMKLKEGSQHYQSLPPEETTSTDNSGAASCCSDTINPDCRSSDCSHNSSICQSMNFSEEKRNKSISILYLYSKYKNSRNNTILPNKEAMVIDNASSSVSIPPTLDQCQLISSSGQHLQEKCIDSLVM